MSIVFAAAAALVVGVVVFAAVVANSQVQQHATNVQCKGKH